MGDDGVEHIIADPTKIVPLSELDYIMLARYEKGDLWAVHEAHAVGVASLRAEIAQLKALLNYDGQRYESWLEVGQALIDRKAELAQLKESIEILGQRADLEKMRADIAEEKVVGMQSDLQQAEDELQGALVTEQAYISANNERIALLAEVARLEKERDEWKAEEHITSELLEAAEARIREIEGGE